MRILVAGAAGAVGHSLVPRLVAAGHEVVGTTRSESRVHHIRWQGAEAIVADGLDAASIRRAVRTARPDAIVHEMTDLKGASDLRHFGRAFAGSNRLRIEGTDHLIDAAREMGVKRFVAQSYCGWPYARTGGMVKTEDDPLEPDPPREFRRTFDAIRHLEAAVAQATDLGGVVLRYGSLYGHGTGMFDAAFVDQVVARRGPVIGGGGGWWSFIHIDNAVDATVLAIERGIAGIVYNVVDDAPVPVREWLPTLAAMLGAKFPLNLPAWLGRLAAGDHLVIMMTQVRAGSNAKAKRELGWRPAQPSWRQGFAEIAAQRRSAAGLSLPPHRERV